MSQINNSVEKAVAQYIDRADGRMQVVSQTEIRTKANHRSGSTRKIYRVTLQSSDMRFSVYAKQSEDAHIIAKEKQILKSLSANRSNISTTVPLPLFATREVLLTEGFEGVTLQHAIGQLQWFTIKPYVQNCKDMQFAFYNIGSWLAGFHAHAGLKELLGRAEHEGLQDDVRPAGDGCGDESGTGLFFECICGEPETVMLQLLANYLEHWGGRYLDARLKNHIQQTLPRLIAAHPPVGTVGPFHGDFCHHNILFDLEQRRACIFDFERAGIGRQIFDVVRFCAKLRHLTVRLDSPFTRSLLGKLEKSFLDGYGARKACDRFTFDALFLIALLCIRSPLEPETGAGITRTLRVRARRRRYRRLIEREWAEFCRVWTPH